MRKYILLVLCMIIASVTYGASISGIEGVGLVTTANISNDIVTSNYNGSITATSFTGDGSGLTGISHPTFNHGVSFPGLVFGVATDNMARDYGSMNPFRVPSGTTINITEFAVSVLGADTGATSPNMGLVINGVHACTLSITLAGVYPSWLSTAVTHDNVATSGTTFEYWDDAGGTFNDGDSPTAFFYYTIVE